MRKGLLLCLILFAGLGISQGQDVKKWTLKECVDVALEKNR
jgi:hypothetical protein